MSRNSAHNAIVTTCSGSGHATTSCGCVSDTQVLSGSLRTRVPELRRNVPLFHERARRWIQIPSLLGKGTSNRVHLERTRLLVMAFLISASWYVVAQSTDHYSVQQSGGSSESPVQPPPGSDLWIQQQRLSKLSNLRQEINDYINAKKWSEYQKSLEDNLPWWSTIWDKIPDPNAKSNDPQAPPDDERKILGRSAWGDPHLETWQHAILYDAKKLGIQIPTEGMEGDRLSQAVSAIDSEMAKSNLAVSKMSDGAQQPALPSDPEQVS